ncbi:adenylyl-sulfate kinase [Vreelandella lionensis]|uniref:Adenylyl-sulfate kinase n=1 Tax=Vreelandella lionensis TaxID=1144478 RepID=A0ABW8BSR3_9GAMM
MPKRVTSLPGRVVWLTGLSGSGKSTLAAALRERLAASGYNRVYHLDGDCLRDGLNADLGFSAADRTENLRRSAHVARLLMAEGYIVLAAFITPLNSQQALVRSLFPSDVYCEVYLSTPLIVCETRDPKGLYRRSRSGDLPNMTGVDSDYEPPEQPELTLNTELISINAAVERLMSALF